MTSLFIVRNCKRGENRRGTHTNGKGIWMEKDYLPAVLCLWGRRLLRWVIGTICWFLEIENNFQVPCSSGVGIPIGNYCKDDHWLIESSETQDKEMRSTNWLIAMSCHVIRCAFIMSLLVGTSFLIPIPTPLDLFIDQWQGDDNGLWEFPCSMGISSSR